MAAEGIILMKPENDHHRTNKLAAVLAVPAVFLFIWWILEMQGGWESTRLAFVPWMIIAVAGITVWKRWPNRPKFGSTPPTWLPTLLGIAAVPFLIAAAREHDSTAHDSTRLALLSLGGSLYFSGFILLVWDWQTLKHFALVLTLAFFVGIVPYVLQTLSY